MFESPLKTCSGYQNQCLFHHDSHLNSSILLWKSENYISTSSEQGSSKHWAQYYITDGINKEVMES